MNAVSRARRCAAASLAMSAALLAAGCNTESGVGHIEGTVRVRDSLLTSSDSLTWEVIFTSADGKAHPALVGLDGKFSVQKVPTGVARISLVGQSRVPPGLSVPGKPAPRLDEKSEALLKLLVRFKSPDRSGLTYAVAMGQQTHDIVLDP